MLIPVTFGSDRFSPPWYSYPVVFHGTLLLLGGLAFAPAQRLSAQRPPAQRPPAQRPLRSPAP